MLSPSQLVVLNVSERRLLAPQLAVQCLKNELRMDIPCYYLNCVGSLMYFN